MKEYLKMSDVFFTPTKRFTEDGSIGRVVGSNDEDVIYIQPVIELADGEYSNSLTPAQKRNALAEYAAHAINSHDELVSEVVKLRKIASECYPFIKDKADWGTAYEKDLADRLFDLSI